jgi:hypothetical protein
VSDTLRSENKGASRKGKGADDGGVQGGPGPQQLVRTGRGLAGAGGTCLPPPTYHKNKREQSHHHFCDNVLEDAKTAVPNELTAKARPGMGVAKTPTHGTKQHPAPRKRPSTSASGVLCAHIGQNGAGRQARALRVHPTPHLVIFHGRRQQKGKKCLTCLSGRLRSFCCSCSAHGHRHHAGNPAPTRQWSTQQGASKQSKGLTWAPANSMPAAGGWQRIR